MKIAVLIPCFKRPEYTEMCLRSIFKAQDYEDVTFCFVDDGSQDETSGILMKYKRSQDYIQIYNESVGLRNVIIDFFEWTRNHKPMYITKVDNDCTVPTNWLTDLTRVLEDAKADVISPNTSETNAAFKYGAANIRVGEFIPSKIVGGLWFMKRQMLDGLYFEKFSSKGIRAAFHLINQIIIEHDPKIGWTDAVTYQDIGFWAGTHPDHIKSFDHAMYSVGVGRRIAWKPEEKVKVDNADVPA